nr:cation-transporting P-type ATPase [Candidatus Sigynarchaeum springense]
MSILDKILGKFGGEKARAKKRAASVIAPREHATYYAKDAEAVLAEFKTDDMTGLSSEEAQRRQVELGLNELPKVKRSIYKLYFAPVLENTIIVIFLLAATLMLVISVFINKSLVSPLINFFVILLNAGIAVIQQIRAQKSLESLKRLSKNVCTVIRGGIKISVDSVNVVPGDILDLQEGDRIVADARVVSDASFFVNESAITGESQPVQKTSAPLPDKISISRIHGIKNCVFSGTFVTKGNARAVVFATGINTEIGYISKNLNQVTAEQEIPLKAKINKFANWLAIFVGIMFVAIWIYVLVIMGMNGTITNSTSFWWRLVNSIELALKFVPINIVLLSTIILITGVVAIAAKGVITRKLTAIEALGRASVVCTDKTGTLTKNAMTVQKVWATDRLFDVTGLGYSKEGAVLLGDHVVNKDDYKSLKKLVVAGLLDNNAEVVEEDFKVARKGEHVQLVRKVIGDPMEGALDVLGEKLKIYESEMLKHLKFIKEFPFDSDLKRMTKIWSSTSSKIKHEWMAFIKGATELILDRSTSIMEDEEEHAPLDGRRKKRIKDEVEKWASKGFRTLGIAWKDLKALPEGREYTRDEVETDITFLGFVVIQDPPREGVRDAVLACERAGVTVVMITGDSRETGAAIGRELGIYDPGEVIIEGKDIHDLDDETFMKTAVFARVSPNDKQVIVKRYQDKGKTVAMTGDGVNDALALGLADVGLAMGLTGTDVAKEAADMIISDDSFNTIELGIKEGRGLFAKIRTMIFFYIFVNVAEAIVLISTAFVNIDFRLFDTGLQINLIYVLPHTFPPLGLTFDRTSLDVMQEKPRNTEEIFSKNVLYMLIILIAYMVFVLTIVSLPIINAFNGQSTLVETLNLSTDPSTRNILTRDLNIALEKPRTIAFCVIFISETVVAYSIRRPNIPVWKSFRKDMSPTLIFFTILIFLGMLGVVYAIPLLPGWNEGTITYDEHGIAKVSLGFYVQMLNGEDWVLVLALSLPIIPLIEVYKCYVRSVKKQYI